MDKGWGKFIQWWFSNVRKALGHSNSYFEIRIIKQDSAPKQYFFQTPQSAIEWCNKYYEKQDGNVYFGLQPRKTTRGRTEDVEALVFYGVDFDAKNKDKKDGVLEEDYKDIIKWANYELYYFINESKTIPPHAVIGSGNGIQLFWVHNAALPTPANLDRHSSKTIQNGNDILSSIPHPNLFTDEVKDGARVLRLAGFKNAKGGRESELLYLTEDEKGEREIDFDVIKTSRSLEKALNTKIGKNKRYAYFTSLVGLMASHNIPKEEVEKTLIEFNKTNCEEPAPDHYIYNALSSYDRWLKSNVKFKEIKDSKKTYEDFVKESSSAKSFEELEKILTKFCILNASTPVNVITSFKKELYKVGVPVVVQNNISLIYINEVKTIYTFTDNGIWESGEHIIHSFLETQNQTPEAKIKFTSAQKKETCIQLQHRNFKKITDFDNEPPYLIPVSNGVLDLRTLELKPYTADLLFTKKLNVKYNPSAKCDRFEQFLDEISPDNKKEKDLMIKGLKQLIGYCLYKKYPIQKIFMLIGGGSNGKGVFLTVLKALFGEDNVSAVSIQSLSNDKFSGAELFNMYINLSSELTTGELKNTDLLKSLCGGDLLMAQKKFMHPFKFINGAKLIVASNQPPEVVDASVGWFRRVHMFRFTKEFTGKKADKTLEKQLVSEESLSGILNLAVTELREWLDENGSISATADFCNSMDIEDVRETYERLSDPVSSFVFEVCTSSNDSDAYVTKESVYKTYCRYVEKRNLQKLSPYVFNKKFREKAKFVSEFRPQHITDSNGIRERCWYGIKLLRFSEQTQTGILN